MSRCLVVPIVEGQGDAAAVPLLLRRICSELAPAGAHIEVLQPVRVPRGQLVPNSQQLLRGLDFALLKIQSKQKDFDHSVVLILFDADDDLPCELAPRLLGFIAQQRGHAQACCVIANPEFETWFVGAAPSLLKFLNDVSVVENPETRRVGKGWIKKHFSGRYSEVVDQPRLATSMDLALARRTCPSFDKLCREVLSRLD